MFDIVITSRDRHNYLRITLATLKEAVRDIDPNAFHIYLWDYSLLELPTIITEFSNLTVIRQDPSWAQGSSHTRYNHIITHAFIRSDKQYLLSVDSDACFHPQFYGKCLELINDLPGIGYGGIFNCPNSPTHEIVQNKYSRKPCIGFFATLINRDVWKNLLESGHGLIDTNVEYGLANFCYKTAPHGVCTTINSYVEHIGMTGSHHWGDGSIDRSINFLD